MKQAFLIRSRFGITQDEIAQLLGIGRSQWSMFESGKRDLPTKAKLLLASIIQSLEPQDPAGKQLKQHSINPEMEQHLKNRLLQNKFNLLCAERKLEITMKKQETNLALLTLTQVLMDKLNTKSPHASALVEQLNAKASEALSEKGSMAIPRQELRLELLKQEKEVLEVWLARLHEPGQNK